MPEFTQGSAFLMEEGGGKSNSRGAQKKEQGKPLHRRRIFDVCEFVGVLAGNRFAGDAGKEGAPLT